MIKKIYRVGVKYVILDFIKVKIQYKFKKNKKNMT